VSADLQLALPEEWQTAPIQLVAPPMPVSGVETGGPYVVLNVMLEDGTNVVALICPTGQRLVRCSEHNDLAIEERFTGQPLPPILDGIWRCALDALRHGRDEELRQNGGLAS
jgi:hypothetical protein